MIISHLISALLILTTCIAGIVGDVDIYKKGDALVVETGYRAPFQVNGIIFGTFLEHEYGHYLQQKRMGDMAYYTTVAIPSLLSLGVLVVAGHLGVEDIGGKYLALPWEAEAEQLGEEYFNQFSGN